LPNVNSSPSWDADGEILRETWPPAPPQTADKTPLPARSFWRSRRDYHERWRGAAQSAAGREACPRSLAAGSCRGLTCRRGTWLGRQAGHPTCFHIQGGRTCRRRWLAWAETGLGCGTGKGAWGRHSCPPESGKAKVGRTRAAMAMHTATYGRSVSHSRDKAEVAIFVELLALKGAKRGAELRRSPGPALDTDGAALNPGRSRLCPGQMDGRSQRCCINNAPVRDVEWLQIKPPAPLLGSADACCPRIVGIFCLTRFDHSPPERQRENPNPWLSIRKMVGK